MRAKSFSDMACSIAGALEVVGDRWGFLLLRDLTLGLGRYDEFQRSTGMPAQTLADRLRHLEQSGLIVRRRYQERPPRDEYALTPKGRDFWKVLAALREWGDRWDAHAGDGPPLEVVDGMTGRHVELALVDVETGEAIPTERLETRPGPGADALVAFRLSGGGMRKSR
jgi:DNA-binding HxlR family transcriptional regulator